MNPWRGLACLLAASLPLAAHAFTLQWPADCVDGETCFVQNYVDHDPSPAAHDFTCGTLTYNNHDGTDIRLPNLAAMRAGVAVLAPADGTVLRVRDGVPDQSVRGPHDSEADVQQHIAALKGHACGNAVVIQHAEGYQSMLCHMRAGSIRVHPGQPVKAGDAVGLVGLSGDTEFPHVHLTVRHDGMVIDPFSATPMASACAATATANLWAAPHPYRPTVLLGDGFANFAPTKDAMRDTPVRLTTMDKGAAALTYWVDLMGLQAADAVTLRIIAPDGSVFAENTHAFTSPRAQSFAFIGRRNQAQLAQGQYVASLRVMRADAQGATQPVVAATHSLTIP